MDQCNLECNYEVEKKKCDKYLNVSDTIKIVQSKMTKLVGTVQRSSCSLKDLLTNISEQTALWKKEDSWQVREKIVEKFKTVRLQNYIAHLRGLFSLSSENTECCKPNEIWRSA